MNAALDQLPEVVRKAYDAIEDDGDDLSFRNTWGQIQLLHPGLIPFTTFVEATPEIAEVAETYYELVVANFLASGPTEKALREILLLAETGIQYEDDLCFRCAKAVLESLIVALEALAAQSHYDLIHLILLSLSRLSGAPEGVLSTEEWRLEQDISLGEQSKATQLKNLLELGLYYEVSTFLDQYRSVKSVAKNDDLTSIATPVLSVLSRKGGSGKTTTALMAMLSFAKHMTSTCRVCIVDLDLTGPVWQYLLSRADGFINSALLGVQDGQGTTDVGGSEQMVSGCLEAAPHRYRQGNLEIQLLGLRDMPRTNRRISIGIENEPKLLYQFVVDMLRSHEGRFDLVVIDNSPGFGTAQLVAHIIASGVKNGASLVLSTPSLADLRGTFLELADIRLMKLHRPLWIINKSTDAARDFISTSHSVVDIAGELYPGGGIVPDRPAVMKINSKLADTARPEGNPFATACFLPIDSDLIEIGQIAGRETTFDAFADAVTATKSYAAFRERVDPQLYEWLHGRPH